MSRLKLAIIGGLWTLAVCFALIIAVGASNRQSNDIPVLEILANLASAADEMAGENVAPNIIVRSTSLDDNMRLTYNYTVTEGSHVDQQLAQEKSQALKRTVCRDRMMRKAVDGGAEIRYSYFSLRGKRLLNIRINKSVCLNLT